MAISRDLAKIPLVCVVWDDAHGGTPGEFTKSEAKEGPHKASVILTFGLLLLDDEEGITLMSEITDQSEDEESISYRCPNFTPRAMVREVINFGIPKRPIQRKPKKFSPPEGEK